jgi:arsenate reductase-like glutaredoxin family protein
MPIKADDIENYADQTERDYDQLRRKVRQTQKALSDQDTETAKSLLVEIDDLVSELFSSRNNFYQKLHHF